jgi:hypothetical protein
VRRSSRVPASLGRAGGGVIGVATMVVDELRSRHRLSAWISAGSSAGAAEIALPE